VLAPSFAAGCAAGPEDEAFEDVQAEETGEGEVLATVETDTIETEANGLACACPLGTEYQAGLCYPLCRPGYDGNGPACIAQCARGYVDVGVMCVRNPHIISADTKSCPWYNKCGLGSSCSKCPNGYINDGCTCRLPYHHYQKGMYFRAGSAPKCSTY